MKSPIPFWKRAWRWLQLYGVALPRTFLQQARLHFHVRGLRMRYQVFDILGGNPPWEPVPTRLLALIIHHTGGSHAHHCSKPEKLRACIEGLMTSFSHIKELKIIILTTPEGSVADSLPKEIREFVEVRFQEIDDPMFLGFRARPIMLSLADSYDYFLWMEDDIVFEDSMFLEKIARFNEAVGRPEVLLSANRFEFYHGVKNYTDLYAWSNVAPLQLGSYLFKQCANPNAGCWILNRPQLMRLAEKGSISDGKISMFGPLESAGFGQLLDCFQVYRPCHPNMHFLEVRHWDARFYDAYLQWCKERGLSPRRPVRWAD